MTWKQQGQAIVGNADYDGLGLIVALSADATTLVAGAPGGSNSTGYVLVYRTDDNGMNMMQLGQTIYGEEFGDQFGRSVDVSADGKTLAIGSVESIARVYYLVSSENLGSSWKQLGQNITGEEDGDKFGGVVSLSHDGSTLAVGGYNAASSGLVRVYHLDNGRSWKKIGDDIDCKTNLNFQVSLSGNGTTVAIGSPWNGDSGVGKGLVNVYRTDSEGVSWKKLGQSMYGNVTHDLFGMSLDLSYDGDTLAIGSPGYWGNEDRPGYVQVRNLESSGDAFKWKQLGQDMVGEEILDMFGWSVSLSGDGKTTAVGGVWHNARMGRVRVFQMNDSGMIWIQLGDNIDGTAANDRAGEAVSLSADGKMVAVGAFLNDDNGTDSGQVRVFVLE